MREIGKLGILISVLTIILYLIAVTRPKH